MSNKVCCVPGCSNSAGSEDVLHKFPNPAKNKDRFNTWIYSVGGDILGLGNEHIFKYRRVCHKHFEEKYWCRNNLLSNIAVPTRNMPGLSLPTSTRRPLRSIENILEASSSKDSETPEINTYCTAEDTQMLENVEPVAGPSHVNAVSIQPSETNKDIKIKHNLESNKTAISKAVRRKKLCTSVSQVEKHLLKKLSRVGVKLSKCRSKVRKQALKIKAMQNIVSHPQLSKSLDSLPNTAKMLTLLQFREHKKGIKGRRFTLQEKIMALSIYKQSPKGYRFFRRIFILPSPQTLIKLINMADIKPGINDSTVQQLKKATEKMKVEDRLCLVLFDEMSLKSSLSYNERKDSVTGFVTNGKETRPEFADHAQVFMIRGFIRNYKQPIAYTFSQAATKGPELAAQLKAVIEKLQEAGLIVVATVCDQGTNNVNCLKLLIQETKANLLRKGEEQRGNYFIVNNQEIIPLYDPPHLLKCIRNNLISKDLTYYKDGSSSDTSLRAKWSHITKLHGENPGYRGIRLVPKLTDYHCIPSKIPRMKVKYATQIFSQTVASNMGYLADKGILTPESKETADILLFFDRLFDSVNGSFGKRKKHGKPLLGPASPTSVHHQVWDDSKKMLKKMKFVNSITSKVEHVPTLNNWVWTIEGIQLLITKMANNYGVNSIYLRHLNQDPIENFFGSIRSHGCRNVNPSTEKFESAFTTLLINSLSSAHAPGANCETDNCYALSNVIITESDCKETTVCEFPYIQEITITPLEEKNDPRKMGGLHPCKCPPKTQEFKHYKTVDCRDVTDIIEALTYEAEISMKGLRSKPPKFKTKPFKPRHYKDTCVPMVPSMHTRLRYIGHCAVEPPTADEKARQAYGKYDFASTSEETISGILRRKKKKKKKKEKYKKKVTYFDMLPGDIMLPTPAPVIKHTASDKSILNVASPKISGEVIQARRASVKPVDMVPPLPPKAADQLYKPHSGIWINRDNDPDSRDRNVPEVVHVPGPTFTRRRDKRKPCRKGGVCYRKTCSKKKCRRYAAMRQRRMSRQRMRGHSEASYTTLGVTDGKPRARGAQKHRPDDDDDVCGLDEIPRPEHAQIPAHLKKGMLQTHSLTVLPCTKEKKADIHYGILTGSFNMYDAKFGGRSKGRQALTMSVMAYCLAFHYHPKQWTMKLVDNLVDAGDQWYLQCLEKVHDHSAVQGICEVLPFGKKQTLALNGKRMQVLLGEPDFVGYTMSLDPTVYNLCRGLKAFFKENRAGVLMTRVLKVVIWKDRICYYIFDPAGRDSRAYSNFGNGCAALMNVKDLDSVSEILLARSIVEDQKFVLAAVKVLKMIDEKCDEDIESDRELTQAEKAMMGYRILNENCAIVNANMHLGDRCFEDAKYRQALTIAVAAMTYAKISPPNTWFTKTLDKILRLGNKLYVDCTHPKVMIDLTIDNIPNEIIVGPYACEIIIYRERIKGQLFTTKECLFNIRSGLEEFFSHEYNSGILEFNNYALAVWRQRDMYYLFDPYPRTNDGLRSLKVGRGCCMMLLNSDTMAAVFTKNWDYMPSTTQFYIHAFKVLKLKKREPKTQIVCTLSDEQLPGAKSKVKRKVLPMSQAKGDGKEILHDVMPMNIIEDKVSGQHVDEEHMGDIISLVDSIQEDYLPPIPLRYKNMEAEPLEPKIVNLDSPTVSVTQVVPPWPKPRDKTNEPVEPDPDREPTPPPTPPPMPPPEGGEEEQEEEEGDEEEEDEETMKRKKEEADRIKAEEEEARRKAEELPPPLPPPPPSPQGEPEVPLAAPVVPMEDEVQTMEPVNVERRVLLTEDARFRSKLRQLRKKTTPPLMEAQVDKTPSQELALPSNFKNLPDNTQIIRGTSGISDTKGLEVLPFAAIMAIVTSYKYSINTWTPGIVDFVVDTANKLYNNKQEKFQLAPAHIIPKIAIGHQAYHANIDVVGEGATWQMEDVLTNKYFPRFDRGMITTSNYSCAFFKRNGLFYLYDGSSTCNAMGVRDEIGKNKGKACLLRFSHLHDLVSRVLFNKDGKTEDEQFILSRILVRRLLTEPRMKLPEDYDFETGRPKSTKSKPTFVSSPKASDKKSSVDESGSKSQTVVGYQQINGGYRLEGTTSLKDKGTSVDVKSCHFVSLIAMLMATMHPIRTWDHVMVDTCIEKGLEIHEKATNLSICEKRVIKNVILDGKFININIKKITVVNENPEKRLEQYLRAVLRRLRYVLVRFPSCSLVICQSEGYYHLFDPYPSGASEADEKNDKKDTGPKRKANKVASWTLYRSIDALIHRLKKGVSGSVDSPEFYTFELTSVKTAPRHSAMNYRLSPLFKPDENPNSPYLSRRKVRPTVDEKMYWLNIESIPWSRMNPFNDLGFERNTPRALWKEWDIELPGDLYSLWGTVHPMDSRFDPNCRGKQYLATSVVAIVMTQACNISAWTSSFLDGIVQCGDKYHKKCADKFASKSNHEIMLEDLDTKFDDMFPYSFTVKFEKVIFGFVYNMLPDRFNLSKALVYFFETHKLGILTSPMKNLAFGKLGMSYFMFDCQSHGAPVFCTGQGAAYILKCESINRLIYCMALTLNIRRHGQQFHLYSVNVTLTEKTK